MGEIDNKEIPIEDIKALSEELNCPYILTSAKTGTNVQDAFKYAGYKRRYYFQE